MPLCRESDKSPGKNKDGEYELTFIVEGTTDIQEAESLAYAKAPPVYLYRFRKAPEVTANGRGLFEFRFPYAIGQEDEDEPQGDQPTLGTLQVSGAGNTQHVSQCLSQVAYPAGKGQGFVDSKVVGWHKDGVNGVDIKVPGSRYSLTKKWLPQAITGNYLDGLDELQGKTNQAAYTIRWGFNGNAYALTCQSGELLFDGYAAKTDVTRSGAGIWEVTYEMIRSKNRTSINVGKDASGTTITVDSKKGHEYLWAVYESKEITNPSGKIEVPAIACVARLYEEANFLTALGF